MTQRIARKTCRKNRSVDEEPQRGRKAAQTDTEIPEEPDLGAQPLKMSNDPTNREDKKVEQARSVNEKNQGGRKPFKGRLNLILG